MNILSELRTSRSARVSLIIITAVAAYYGFLSYITPWFQDDITYQFNIASEIRGDSLDRINSIGDIFESQIAHYTTWNGRFVAHSLVQLFCGILGHGPFAVFNAIFYILFILMVLKLSNVTFRNTGAVLTTTILTIISFQSGISPACQISYIWMYVLIMAFIWLFFNQDRKQSPLIIVLLGIFSLIAGNAHESLNIGISVGLIIYWIKNREQMSVSQYVMFICFGLGALFCCLSPGIIERALAKHSSDSYSFFLRFGKMTVKFAKCITALYILTAIVGWKILHLKESWRNIYAAGPFYWNSLIALFIFSFGIGIGGNRQLFGLELISIILSIKLLKNHSFTRAWILIIGFMAVVSMFFQTEYSWRFAKYFDRIVHLYQKSPNGDVFINFDDSSVLSDLRTPVSPIPYYGLLPGNTTPRNPDINYDDRCFIRYFATAYPGHPPIKILPTQLQGKQHLHLPNQVIKISSHHVLVIQDKSVPSDIIIKRSVDIPGFHKVLPDENISEPDFFTYDADYWRAYIYDLSPFATYGRVTRREIQIVQRPR